MTTPADPLVSRRGALAIGAFGAAAIALPARRAKARPEPYPVTAPDLAREMVGASHAQLDRVRGLLSEDAGLAKASWDWGFGDWETALGAASHTGRVDIVEVLLAHGARPDVFTFAVLDRVDAVRAIVESVPHARALTGPHGISLASHAAAGGADRVSAYLAEAGLAAGTGSVITPDLAGPYLGTYAWSETDADRFVVAWNDRAGTLTIAREGRLARALSPVADDEFSPVGAPHVRVRFERDAGRPVRIVVTGSGPEVTAGRVPG
jgi:hypothetical protein